MNPVELAHIIINMGIRANRPVSNLHLQKILYFTNLVYLQNNHVFLVNENSFEAWMHGPVVPKVYYNYSMYGGIPISKAEPEPAFISNASGRILNAGEEQEVRSFIERLINIDPWTLVDYSHSIGGAWEKTYQISPFGPIDPTLIRREAGI